MTEHFNGLTEAQAERLAVLIEECGEVVQIACKILRHGYESCHPLAFSGSNREELEKEIGHVNNAVRMMEEDLNPKAIGRHQLAKAQKIAAYLHHQGVAK